MYIKLNWQKGMAYNLFDFGRRKRWLNEVVTIEKYIGIYREFGFKISR